MADELISREAFKEVLLTGAEYLDEDTLMTVINILDTFPIANAVVLPCKVGDTVWFIPQYGGKPLCGVREDKVQMIGVTSRGFHLKLRANHDHNKMYMLGKTVFLTKEEAEKALGGREDNG